MSLLGISIMNWLFLGALYVIPGIVILRKAGYSGWWILTLLVPFVSMIMPWAFALSKWPLEREVERARNSARAEVVLLRRQLERDATAREQGPAGIV